MSVVGRFPIISTRMEVWEEKWSYYLAATWERDHQISGDYDGYDDVVVEEEEEEEEEED